jgi:hypothetical protein
MKLPITFRRYITNFLAIEVFRYKVEGRRLKAEVLRLKVEVAQSTRND